MTISEQDTPLSTERLEERLEEHVEAVLSFRRTAAGPAQQLAQLGRAEQEFVLHWVGAAAETNSEMAFQLAAFASEAMAHMPLDGVEAWILEAMDAFDRKGLVPGIAALQEVEGFARERESQSTGVALDEIAGVLGNFVRGLSGRELRIEASTEVHTDTETLFLPAQLRRCGSPDRNFKLYKAMAAHQWAQIWYGTWRVDVAQALRGYADPPKAIGWFHALETVRLNARIAADYPGLHREMEALSNDLDEPQSSNAIRRATARLQKRDAAVSDVIELVARVYDDSVPEPRCYQGSILPGRVQAVVATRAALEKQIFRARLAKLKDELQARPAAGDDPEHEFSLERIPDPEMPDGFNYLLEFGDQSMPIPDDLRGVAGSIIQDLGEIPEDYLVPAGSGGYGPGAQANAPDPDDVWKGTYHEEGAHLYNEWDHARQHYRKDWCVLRERDVHPQWDNFVAKTLRRHGGLVTSLRRTFEALRGEEKLLKRQPHGEDVDIDALVEGFADVKSGREMSDRLFTKRGKYDRNIAVMFMVDMSGSTKGWINDAEREALVLLCEALETLGDRYAIYGFSGMTRKRCEVFRIKRFDEPYGDMVQARISGILPQDYTRMGVVIRHLSRLLNEVDARTKLLVTLSDGKPDDYVDYRGVYGIEDTRQALLEARRDGVHPFCVTIDDEARDYLPHMYGAVNYVVINDVMRLPLKLSDVYRKLTT